MGTTYRFRGQDRSDGSNVDPAAATRDANEQSETEISAVPEQTQPVPVPSELAAARKLIRQREQGIAELQQRLKALEEEAQELRRSLAGQNPEVGAAKAPSDPHPDADLPSPKAVGPAVSKPPGPPPRPSSNSSVRARQPEALPLVLPEVKTSDADFDAVDTLAVDFAMGEPPAVEHQPRLPSGNPLPLPSPPRVPTQVIDPKPPAADAWQPEARSTDFEPYPTLRRVSMSMGAVAPSAEGGQDSLRHSERPAQDSMVPSSRRRNQRLQLELELEFKEDTHFYAGITQDLSQGGVFVATYRLLAVGTLLWLAFDLPDGTHVRTRGEVRWLRGEQDGSLRPGMGVAFVDLPEPSLRAIEAFCCARAPLYIEI